MFRLILRGIGLFVLILLLVPVGFSKNPAANSDKDPKKTDDATSAASADATAPSDPANTDDSSASEAASPAPPAPPAQKAASDKSSSNDDYKPAPKFTPMLATTGTLGMFTLETGDTLPKHGFAFSAFGNKFGRMPGSVTILEIGVDASYGVTDNFNIYAGFDPYGHVHVGCPGQLSLRSIPLSICAPMNTGTPAPIRSLLPSPAPPRVMCWIILLPRTITAAREI